METWPCPVGEIAFWSPASNPFILSVFGLTLTSWYASLFQGAGGGILQPSPSLDHPSHLGYNQWHVCCLPDVFRLRSCLVPHHPHPDHPQLPLRRPRLVEDGEGRDQKVELAFPPHPCLATMESSKPDSIDILERKHEDGNFEEKRIL